MEALILLAIAAALFGLAPILLRSNAVYIFLMLCAGELCSRLIASDLTKIVNSIIETEAPTYSVVQIFLLVIVPLVLLAMFRRGVKSSKVMLQILPAISTVVIAFMLVVVKLPYDLQVRIQDSNTYNILEPYFGLAMAIGLLTSLFYLWTKRPNHKEEKKNHK